MTYQTYTWTQLSKYEQNEARRIARGAAADIASASVSQVAKHLDAFRDYAAGRIDKAGLYEATDGAHGEKAAK